MISVLIDGVCGHVTNREPANEETQEGCDEENHQRDAVDPQTETQRRCPNKCFTIEYLKVNPIQNGALESEFCMMDKELYNQPNG